MKEQFTQGDWNVPPHTVGPDDQCEVVFNEAGECIAEYVHSRDDAHLIAAAPKMYKLLQKFLPCDEDGNGVFLYNDGSEYLGDEVTKLLAEARGEIK